MNEGQWLLVEMLVVGWVAGWFSATWESAVTRIDDAEDDAHWDYSREDD